MEITGKMRERFNQFARDYRWVYIPDMNYYESFFEANQYAKSFGYTNFGFAVFYVLQYMRCPDKVSAEAVQNAIQNLFVAKESYKDIPHQAYRKLANYEDGYYSPWPEGGLDHDRMFYLLTGLEIVQEKVSNDVYITVRAKSYYFNDTNVYEAGEDEKWLPRNREFPICRLPQNLLQVERWRNLKAVKNLKQQFILNSGDKTHTGMNHDLYHTVAAIQHMINRFLIHSS